MHRLTPAPRPYRQIRVCACRAAFVTGFFKGISSKAAFSQLVASLYFVYEAMETAFDDAKDPRVSSMDIPELRRLGPLERDMKYFYGRNWKTEVSPTPATAAYVSGIRRVATSEEDEYLLIAHMYTRYLGDLFGGSMIRSMARSSLDLDGGSGTDFYEFPKIENTF